LEIPVLPWWLIPGIASELVYSTLLSRLSRASPVNSPTYKLGEPPRKNNLTYKLKYKDVYMYIYIYLYILYINIMIITTNNNNNNIDLVAELYSLSTKNAWEP